MAATRRQERELVTKYSKLKLNSQLSPLEQLRAHTLSKGIRGFVDIRRSFKRIDQNKDKKIDFQEFQGALHHEGIFVEEHVERECFNEMDLDKTGFLNFDEFITALRPPMSSHRKNLIQMAFNKLDKTGDGVVTTEDLVGIYCGKKHPKYLSGEWTENQVLEEWLNSFNGPTNYSGVVQYEEFEMYYCGVSASIDSDAYFDLMMRQAWKL